MCVCDINFCRHTKIIRARSAISLSKCMVSFVMDKVKLKCRKRRNEKYMELFSRQRTTQTPHATISPFLSKKILQCIFAFWRANCKIYAVRSLHVYFGSVYFGYFWKLFLGYFCVHFSHLTVILCCASFWKFAAFFSREKGEKFHNHEFFIAPLLVMTISILVWEVVYVMMCPCNFSHAKTLFRKTMAGIPTPIFSFGFFKKPY